MIQGPIYVVLETVYNGLTRGFSMVRYENGFYTLYKVKRCKSGFKHNYIS